MNNRWQLIKCDMIYGDFCQLLSIDKTGQNIVVYDDVCRSTLFVLAESDYLAQFCGSTLKISLLDCEVVLNMSNEKMFSISQFIAKQSQPINKFDFILNEQEQPSQKQKFSNRPFSFK
jgi:hypothetical protein